MLTKPAENSMILLRHLCSCLLIYLQTGDREIRVLIAKRTPYLTYKGVSMGDKCLC